MRLALIADTFPPLRTSGAVQLRDLSRELVRQGHDLTVILPAPDLDRPWQFDKFEGAQILRLRAPRTKNVGYIRRTLAELAMPFAMRHNLLKSPLKSKVWDGVIWYSPSIFHGPFVSALKRASRCRGYLIIRDIFPEWAADMGLMRRGVAYRFFKGVASRQYEAADTIGVQTPGNLRYFAHWQEKGGRTLEVLPNWLGAPGTSPSTIRLNRTPLAGRKVFVYAGNMGVAQNMDIIIRLAEELAWRRDVGFLLVGRGSELHRLKQETKSRNLTNVLFHDEIDPDEIPDLYQQCHAGIVALDPRHRSHNIPGKFLTYVQCGLPVLAILNEGNDLAGVIRDWEVGEVSETPDISKIVQQAIRLLEIDVDQSSISQRCKSLFAQEFSVNSVADRILEKFIAGS